MKMASPFGISLNISPETCSTPIYITDFSEVILSKSNMIILREVSFTF